MSATFLVVFVGALLAFQPLSTDLNLPSVPAMAAELGLSPVEAQGSFLAYLFGFALGQLPAGAMADRLGRRPVLIWSAALYAASGFTAALAQHGVVLLASRVALGLAIAAMTVAGRAAIRDQFDPEEGEQALAKGFTGMGISAALAGALGGQLAGLMSWRGVMGLLGLSGVVLCVVAWVGFKPRTVAPGGRDPAGAPHARPSAWCDILAHRTFWVSTLLASLSYAEAVCFVSGASVVLPELFNAPPATLGWVLTLCSGTFLVSTLLVQWTLRRWGGRRTMQMAAVLCALASVAFSQQANLPTNLALLGLVAAQMCFMVGHGANQICGQASAVSPFPAHAGLAAAWSGTIMIFVSVACGQVQAVWLDHAIEQMPVMLTLLTAGSAVLAWWQSRMEHGRAQA